MIKKRTRASDRQRGMRHSSLMHMRVVGVCVTNLQHGSLMHTRVHVCTGSDKSDVHEGRHYRLLG